MDLDSQKPEKKDTCGEELDAERYSPYIYAGWNVNSNTNYRYVETEIYNEGDIIAHN